MAIDLETINNAYYKGYADIIPQGQLSRSITCCVTQFEDWPEDVKKVFDYDPEGAEALLDEAGYPRGADGIRFKTELMHLERYDLNYVELVVSYWNKIGIDVEIDVQPIAPFVARRGERDFEMGVAEAAYRGSPFAYSLALRRPHHGTAPMSTTRCMTPSLKPPEPLPLSRSRTDWSWSWKCIR